MYVTSQSNNILKKKVLWDSLLTFHFWQLQGMTIKSLQLGKHSILFNYYSIQEPNYLNTFTAE